MQQCVEHDPPFFQTNTARVTSCYLYAYAPALPPDDLIDVMKKGRDSEKGTTLTGIKG
jgi:hypothetical protein